MMASRAERPGRFVVSDAIFWPADLAMMVEGKSAEIAATTLSCLLRNELFLALLIPKLNLKRRKFGCLIGERC